MKIIMEEWAIQKEIADKLIKLSNIDVFKNSRRREIVEARALLCHILKSKLSMSLTNISKFFKSQGKPMNHATVIHSLKNYDMYKASNKLLKEIEDMFTIKTSMNFKEINRVTYLEDKCIQLENQITTLKGNSPLYELIGKIPKNREEEAVTRIDLIIKSWVWRG
jgi:hypothetical protein|tara:strand:+ start:2626 stop:3120 length:495 start_codon:yes stop_codon:yes gene_type:complete